RVGRGTPGTCSRWIGWRVGDRQRPDASHARADSIAPRRAACLDLGQARTAPRPAPDPGQAGVHSGRFVHSGPVPRALQWRRERRNEMKTKCLVACVAMALSQGVMAAAAAAPDASGGEDVVELDALVVMGAAPVASLTWVTDPRLPRQPVPASDGADYLKTVPGFATLRSGGTNGDPVLRGQFGSRLNLLAGDG